jgi:hypothetical protein
MKLLAVLMLAAAGPIAGLMSHVSSSSNDYNLSLDRREQTLVFGRSEADLRNAKIYIATDRSSGFPID